MPDDVLRMNRFTLQFADTAAEQSFSDEQARKAMRPIRIALVTLGALQASFYFLTIHVFPGVVVGIGAQNMARTTLGAIAVYAAFFALTYSRAFLRRQQLVMFALACLISIGITRSSARLPFEVMESRGFTIILIYTFFIYSALRLRFPQATLAGWLGTCLFVGYTFTLDLLSPIAAGRTALILGVANVGGMLICRQMDIASRREFVAMQMLDREREKSEKLLLNILPPAVAERLKSTETAIADRVENVTVLFADIVGFTTLSAKKSPEELVALLNNIFSAFDALADKHGLEKIKTIGDAYMAVSGILSPSPIHALNAARMAFGMHEIMAHISDESGEPLSLRIGLHSGPVVAGVIGRRKFSYDLWGDTVNTASRMESHGSPGTVHCTQETATLLKEYCRVLPQGRMQIKGKGEMLTFLLEPNGSVIHG